jgi:hypothetical protein
MEESTYNTILIIIIVIVVTCIVGFNIIYLIDKKVSNIAVNIPPLPKPKVTIKFDNQKIQVFNDDEEEIKPKIRSKYTKYDKDQKCMEDFSPRLEDNREPSTYAKSCLSSENPEPSELVRLSTRNRDWDIEKKNFNKNAHFHKEGKEEEQNPQLASDNKPYTNLPKMEPPYNNKVKLPTRCQVSDEINKTINECDKKLKIKYFISPANSNIIDYATVDNHNGEVYTIEKPIKSEHFSQSEPDKKKPSWVEKFSKRKKKIKN